MRLKLSMVCFILLWLSACEKKSETTFTASGIVEGTAVEVAAQTGGYLLKINFDEGQPIVQDDVIAVVDTEKLTYQLQQARASLQETEVQYKISLNTLAKAETDFQLTNQKYTRFQELVEKNSASQQTLDDLKLAREAALTQLENARQNLKLLDSKKTAMQAQINLIHRSIHDATITAPLSGTVTTKYYEAGETIPTGIPVVEIIDLKEMWTKVYISELLLPKIKVDQAAKIKIDGMAESLTGYVSWISPKAEFTPKNILTKENRTSLVYAVKINVVNPDNILKHGMPVEVVLDL